MIFLLYWDLCCIDHLFYNIQGTQKYSAIMYFKSTCIKITRNERVCKRGGMEKTRGQGIISIWYFACFKALALGRSARGITHVHCTDGVKFQKGWQWKKHGAKAIFQSDRIEMLRLLQSHALAITIGWVCQDYCSDVLFEAGISTWILLSQSPCLS